MRAPAAAGLEADRFSPYLGFLFVLLSTATLFDGFDAAMMSLAAPDVRATLDISRGEWSLIFGLYKVGVLISFLLLLQADRFGRRALMMITVVGFTIFTGATALARDAVEFTLFQFLARIFLTAEYALAIIMVGEEFPARWRGRAIAILTSLATVGVLVTAKLQPWILLEPGAPTNALHDAGAAAVAMLQRAVGRPVDGADWRILYLLGVLPLGLVLALRLGMRETRRFEATQRARAASVAHAGATAAGGAGQGGVAVAPAGVRARVRRAVHHALVPWRPEYRRRTAIVALLWNCVHLVTSPAVAFWVIYAREDLGFSPALVGDVIFWAYVGGVVGHFVAGFLVDRVGRKLTCAGFYILASVCIVGLFHTTTMVGQYAWHIATVFCFLAAGTATHVYASELFPTEIRATGYGWTTNFFGRATEIGAPLVVGLFIDALGISWSVTAVAFGPIVGALLVLRYAPETRGLTLEQIQAALAGPGAAPPTAGAAAARAAEARPAEAPVAG
jgi:putative MFS transporter